MKSCHAYFMIAELKLLLVSEYYYQSLNIVNLFMNMINFNNFLKIPLLDP